MHAYSLAHMHAYALAHMRACAPTHKPAHTLNTRMRACTHAHTHA